MTEISPLSVVHPDAKIGSDCVIGPFCTIGAHVEIGARTCLKSHVVVDGHTSIGEDCMVYPFVTLGIDSQDQKHSKGSVSYTRIGDRNTLREFVSVHSGTEVGSVTAIGNDCALLAQAHVAHNCQVGNHVVMSHSATLAGHVVVGDHANIGGLAAVHQFCQIGPVAMVAGMARVVQDVLPYTIAEGFPAHMRVVNKVGLERAGFSSQKIKEIRKAFRILFTRDLRLEEAVAEVRKEIGESDEIKTMLDAIERSQRGLARPDSATFEMNVG
ncbi:acyl-ACP--UDP-N-acetylglucosamine O-acyltransferase [Pseudomonadales bacterium]|nr:acyl-ACP--UDP-N-acetylglucosamine O-acyltransferase [Pseudomonadales bacterium]